MSHYLLSIIPSILSAGVSFVTKAGLDKLFKPEQIKLQEKLNQHFLNLETELKTISGLLEEAQKTNPEAKEILERVKQVQKVGNFSSDNEQITKKEADSDQNIGSNSNRNKQQIS